MTPKGGWQFSPGLALRAAGKEARQADVAELRGAIAGFNSQVAQWNARRASVISQLTKNSGSVPTKAEQDAALNADQPFQQMMESVNTARQYRDSVLARIRDQYSTGAPGTEAPSGAAPLQAGQGTPPGTSKKAQSRAARSSRGMAGSVQGGMWQGTLNGSPISVRRLP
jgi:hypothetical protein